MILRSSAIALAVEFRQAARRLFRSPGFAALAIGTLTVGIGINGAMFALMDALLFRPPPHVAQPQEVVRVQFRVDGGSRLLPRTHYPNFVDLRASGAFAAIAGYDASASVSIGFGGDARLANAMLVSEEFFRVLRPVPRLGSLFLNDGGTAGGGESAIISYGFWQRHFGGESSAVGATLTIDGHVHSVVGVLPSGFPSLGARAIDVWLPLDHVPATGFVPSDWRANRGPFWLAVVGRLAQGVSRDVTEQRATAVFENRRVERGDGSPPLAVSATSVVPGRGGDGSLESNVSRWLAGVSAVVLLIACANVSNLVLIQVFNRRQETYMRLALGASRGDFVRRSLSDTCMIVIPGAVGALIVSFLVRNAVAAFLSGEIPLSRQLWDVRTAGIMAGSAALAFVMVWAVAAALQLRWAATDTRVIAGVAHGRKLGRGTRRTLLAVQAGLCFVLLSAAGLFSTSLRRAESLDLGVELDRTIQLTINFPRDGAATEIRATYERAAEVLGRYPQVEQVALAGLSPYMSGYGAAPWTAERSRAELWPPGNDVAYRSAVGAGFFATVGARSLRGRDFDEGDRAGAPRVAIVNAPLARHLWPDGDALGQCMWLNDAQTCLRIVGVLGGVWKFSALRRDVMTVYLPLGQVPEEVPGALFVRSGGNARTFVAQARSVVQSENPELPAATGVLARDIVDPEFRPWRLGATVFSAFAAIALLITSIGLYGMVAASFALRRKEMAIRIALGAQWTQAVSAAVGEGVASVASGLFAGSVLVVVASRWLGGVLFETSPRDPVVLFQAAWVLLVIAAVAVTVPTVRALLENPVNVLRSE